MMATWRYFLFRRFAALFALTFKPVAMPSYSFIPLASEDSANSSQFSLIAALPPTPVDPFRLDPVFKRKFGLYCLTTSTLLGFNWSHGLMTFISSSKFRASPCGHAAFFASRSLTTTTNLLAIQDNSPCGMP